MWQIRILMAICITLGVALVGESIAGGSLVPTTISPVLPDTIGTLGLIVNRPSDVSLSEAVPDIEDKLATVHALYYGGPVGLPKILMLVRSESATEGMAHVVDDVYISSDRRVLDEVIAAKKLALEQVDRALGTDGHSGG